MQFKTLGAVGKRKHLIAVYYGILPDRDGRKKFDSICIYNIQEAQSWNIPKCNITVCV